MKLETVHIRNFRGIVDETIEFGSITTFVGQNDAGKSTVLAALDAYFNKSKIDDDDFNLEMASLHGDDNSGVEIACTFGGPWDSITLDESEITSFDREHLLRLDGKLEIRKSFARGRSAKFNAVCALTSDPVCGKLFVSDNEALKRLCDKQNCPCENRSSNVQLRSALRQNILRGKRLKDIECELGGPRLQGILNALPCYMLFTADRENMPGDDVVVSPMKAAVRNAFQSERVRRYVEKVEKAVRVELANVVKNTRDVLSIFDRGLVDLMNPDFPAVETQKWCDVFKQFTMRSEDGVPLENRGSGVRRLVLLSFLCAEARRKTGTRRNVIYAIEEPETSQHSDNQIRIVEAMLKLASRKGVQVVLTTHSGHMLKRLAETRIQIVSKEERRTRISSVELSGLNELYVKPMSLFEVSYLLLKDCAPEYHSELYGYIEQNGLNIESWCEKRYKRGREGYAMTFSRKNDAIEALHSYPTYIRDRLHHPENRKYDPPSESEIQMSVEMMREFMREDGKQQLRCKSANAKKGGKR